MSNTIDVTIPLDAEAAKVLANPARREALGRYLSELLKSGRIRDALAGAIAETKNEARKNGLTDEAIEHELESWRAVSMKRLC